jgi:hypothetical protein
VVIGFDFNKKQATPGDGAACVGEVLRGGG